MASTRIHFWRYSLSPSTDRCFALSRMVKKLMRHLGSRISGGRRGARKSLCPPIFHRSDPRALETGSRCPCLGDLAPRGSDSRNSQGSGGESFLRKGSFSTGARPLRIESSVRNGVQIWTPRRQCHRFDPAKQSRAGSDNNVGMDLTRFGCCHRWAVEHGRCQGLAAAGCRIR